MPYTYNGVTYDRVVSTYVSTSYFPIMAFWDSTDATVNKNRVWRDSYMPYTSLLWGITVTGKSIVRVLNLNCSVRTETIKNTGQVNEFLSRVGNPLSKQKYLGSIGVTWKNTEYVENYGNVVAGTLAYGANIFPLTVIIDPEAGGNVTGDGISCNVETCSDCTYYFVTDTDVELQANATANSDWVFFRWEWDDGANTSAANPLLITMSSAKTVKAVFRPLLRFPISGTLAEKKLGHFFFGDAWTRGECPSGTYKKHVGIDLSSAYGDRVDAAHDGTVKKIFTGDHAEWADAIVVESVDGQFTTVYWHITSYGGLAEGDSVTKGQQIATVANLGDNTHFHFGIRLAPYSDSESYAGALPVADGCGQFAYPEKFINPENAIYE